MVILFLSKKYNKIFPHNFFLGLDIIPVTFFSMIIGIEGGGVGVGTT